MTVHLGGQVNGTICFVPSVQNKLLNDLSLLSENVQPYPFVSINWDYQETFPETYQLQQTTETVYTLT